MGVDEFDGASWKGKPGKLAIQGWVDRGEDGAEAPTPLDGCDDENWYAGYSGYYEPVPPKTGAGGRFRVFAVDGGETGPDKNDSLTIIIDGGVFEGYYNTGELQGGNISVPE